MYVALMRFAGFPSKTPSFGGGCGCGTPGAVVAQNVLFQVMLVSEMRCSIEMCSPGSVKGFNKLFVLIFFLLFAYRSTYGVEHVYSAMDFLERQSAIA
eukprot:1137172-Pelagomonas_calceolata.AAC.1